MSSRDLPGFPPPPSDEPPASVGAPSSSSHARAAEAGPEQPATVDDDIFPESNAPTGAEPLRWKKNLVLFLLTTGSVVFMGMAMHGGATLEGAIVQGLRFAVPLLTILLFHEFGHYIAARIHGVPASLPFFIPMPLFSPFGTMGAVIVMKGRIRSRNALLDIGAAGPLAGLVVALPVLAYGISESQTGPLPEAPYVMEGQSLLYVAMKGLFGDVPPGQDMTMSPVAFAGWGGLLVTMINLMPYGQLDGGHVAYALFGPKQDQYAVWVRRSLVLLFAGNLAWFLWLASQPDGRVSWGNAVSNALFYGVWFIALGVLDRLAQSRGQHPPTDDNQLSPTRRLVAIGTLLLLPLLFMPTPWAVYEAAPGWEPPADPQAEDAESPPPEPGPEAQR